MSYKILLLFSFGFLFFGIGCNDPADFAGCVFPEETYELVWSDEFDGASIDESKWTFEIGDGCDRNLCGWGNSELEYYTDRPENAYLSDGNLVIKAKKETPLYQGKYQYTSSRMITKSKGDWRFGRIDVRAKMPIGQGIWPAIWMLSSENVYGDWPTSGEIDIMEYLGHQPERVIGTIHYGHDYRRFITGEYRLPEGNFHDDFHLFSVLWTEDCIQFLVDDILYSGPYTRSTTLPTTWPFDQKFYLILNIAVGGNLPGNPNASTQFPQVMEVDYVRVYQ